MAETFSDPFSDPFGDRFVLQSGEFVPADRARAYGCVAEVAIDAGFYQEQDPVVRTQKLQKWWTENSDNGIVSRLCADDFLNRGIISSDQHDAFINS